ncbi:cytosolic carboxypeptidase-like protein 5 [Pseudomyrmex gracilis]|uniref:cytosolic carboxypeptidase-like protein 5 n=1 Tax=Pseudomyrmex gracilis TaxID=219809 RepID=UPI000995D277|nr:cytosolic carboxypeptidase-like protein 5 [Pseudomyrmex gracilis]XP_020299650.1 cytosolic carboxypeptidase-like protein 5 [Pseudomyrmex gracilis]XP_020299651.1 cytosolic carboxypeptidase-like protein 5 [Pseudomyrmex gracilis]XP_020299652.1 cytosolic carboxypeptidase-like protein 5 [Pseudomyrmex gracilis]
MASTAENITCSGFVFFNNFDSANLAKVEQVRISEKAVDKDVYEIDDKSSSNTFNSKDAVDYEFNLWTKHDCHGTQFQNNNRTWFYFGVRSNCPSVSVKFNLVNLNKQVKMFSQGMCPVFKIVPGHLNWERIRERPTYTLDQKGNEFTLSFLYYTPENSKAITYFAFTYPFSYTDLQNYLKKVDARMGKGSVISEDDIYYHRECAIKSLEGRRLDVLTISSYHNITQKREDRLNNMFPELSEERPYKFRDKKVIFISARVHPGETPSSFVLNGFLNFLLNREDQVAINLRRLYVFKLIPMLNPDGVARGHYRMDTKGVNLNRVYLHPSQVDHPTIYAARNLIRYYHHSYQVSSEPVDDDLSNINLEIMDNNIINSTASLASNHARDTTTKLLQQVTLMSLDEKNMYTLETTNKFSLEHADSTSIDKKEELSKRNDKTENITEDRANDRLLNYTTVCSSETPKSSNNSGLYLYIDLHGHASKKGVFMYGNHFTDPEDTVTCMLLPKLMSINNPHFHFASCNFAERNMYIIDKRDGMSREGSGRVAVYRMTGLIRSYTLECNYNSGRLVNTIPPRVRDKMNKTMNRIFIPPKYTPAVFETVGAALGPSILDLTENNPNSRLPNSQYRSLRGVKSHLKLMYVNNLSTPTNKSMRKDNVDAVAQNTCILKDVETKLNDAMTGTRNVVKNENKLMKKSILRRGVSLYSAMKRIKSSKKPRQTRQALRTHSANNVENSTVICTIKSEVKPFLKTIHYCRSTRSNIESVISSDILKPRLNICTNKKLITTSNSMKTCNISIEETTAVKHGSKRLKMISSTMTKNTLSEIEESFCSETSTKVSSKMTRVHGKQNIKEINNKIQIPGKSSKMKKMNKNSSVLEEDTK